MRMLLWLLLLNPAGWPLGASLATLHAPPPLQAQSSVDMTGIADSAFLDAQVGWLLGTACHSQQGVTRCPLRLRQTQDGGKTWSVLPTPQIDAAQAQHIHFASRQVGWLYGAGLYITRDGGQTWANAARSISALQSVGSSIWAIEQRAGQSTGRVTGPIELPNTRSVLIHSADYGETWSDVQRQPPQQISTYSQLVRTSARQAWIVTPTEIGPLIQTTADGGQHWRHIPNFMNHMPCGLATHRLGGRDHLWLLCSGDVATAMQSKRLYTSLDEGRSWMIPADNMYFQPVVGSLPIEGYFSQPPQLAVVSAKRAFLGLGRSTLFVTNDGGQTWEAAIPYTQADPASTGGISSVFFVDTRHGWALTPGRALFRTIDGGVTWQTIEVLAPR